LTGVIRACIKTLLKGHAKLVSESQSVENENINFKYNPSFNRGKYYWILKLQFLMNRIDFSPQLRIFIADLTLKQAIMLLPGNYLTEEFLQFIWEQHLFNDDSLRTVSGETVEVIETGTHNFDAGPDFFNARIRIAETLWAGNIEIHKNSSDWKKHSHQEDEAYDNIILHVVLNFDRIVTRVTGEEIPTLVLPFSDKLFDNYQQLMDAKTWIPCQENFHLMDRLVMMIGFNRLMIERLEEKTGEIVSRLNQNKMDWNETFYQFLAKNFGFKINALPFELLSRSLPLAILSKHKDDLFQLEALFFGQSGLLHEALLGDDYFLSLRGEYDFLAKKYHLRPMAAHLWKFLRLRPVNFPTIRMAQFAALFHQSSVLFSKIIETFSLTSIGPLLDVKASEYWNTHFKFSYPSSESVKHLGEEASENLIINTLIPFIFVYGEITDKYFLKDRALEWLDKLPAESNAIISRWKALGVEAGSAFESQALLQLKNRYCDRKRCLHCHIGTKLIKYQEH
jgi:hypothetical protein